MIEIPSCLSILKLFKKMIIYYNNLKNLKPYNILPYLGSILTNGFQGGYFRPLCIIEGYY
jgi:hypothetical protein